MKETPSVTKLIEDLRSDDAEVRTQAWLGAPALGAKAITPLAGLMNEGGLETARAAKRALWKIVHTVGAPEVDEQEKQAVLFGLVSLLGVGESSALRREVLWMISEIGSDSVTPAVSPLLFQAELREDARCALQRIPGDRSLDALKQALEKVPEEFRMNIVQSLRARGVQVRGFPCRKLVPTR